MKELLTLIRRRLSDAKERVNKQAKKSRYLEFNVTVEYLLQLWMKQNGKCAIENIPLSIETHSITIASLDRINSDVGYVEGNVQWVTKRVNIAKSNLSDADFKAMIFNAYKGL
jgi:hypothetical protein